MSLAKNWRALRINTPPYDCSSDANISMADVQGENLSARKRILICF